MIHREGHIILLITFLSLLIVNTLTLLWTVLAVQILVLIASVVVLGLFLQFFRNPTRNTVVNPGHVICPADGKVVVIEEVEESEYFNDRRIQISVFMSPFNVHVNRNPVSGNVTYDQYHPGKYLVAWHPKASTLNERTTLVIKNDRGVEILFRQIAGAVARRIRYYIHKGDQVEQGQEMGFIKFGSRVDIFIPVGSKINVKLDDNVTGGESVLAELDF